MSADCCIADLDLDGWTVPGGWTALSDAQAHSSSKWGSSSSGSDPSQEPQLLVIRQPEEQHRARYLSEGSRGAIKDRSGTSHCTIQLVGYYRATRVEIYAGTCSGGAGAHQLYELIPVSGKGASTTPCKKTIARDGIRCLEVTLRPEYNMTAVLDCVGILKICSYDMRRRSAKNGGNCSVRLIFRGYVPFENGSESIIQVESEPIRCVQQLGVPEVLKMSLECASSAGKEELFIIGRNFDRNSSVIFREYKDDGSLSWSAEATVLRQFSHQCHIVCAVPQYYNASRGGIASLTVRCGSKSSHPIPFKFVASEEVDDWRPPRSPEVFRDSKYHLAGCERIDEVVDGDHFRSFRTSTMPAISPLFRFENDVDEVSCDERNPRKRARCDSQLLP